MIKSGEEKVGLGETTAPAEFMLRFSGGEGMAGVRLYSDGEHFTEIGLDRAGMKLYMDRTQSGGEMPKDFSARTEAPLAAGSGSDLHVVVDRSSVEVFAQDGTVAMTNLVLAGGTGVRVEMFRMGGGGVVKGSGRLWKLKGVWGVAAR